MKEAQKVFKQQRDMIRMESEVSIYDHRECGIILPYFYHNMGIPFHGIFNEINGCNCSGLLTVKFFTSTL